MKIQKKHLIIILLLVFLLFAVYLIIDYFFFSYTIPVGDKPLPVIKLSSDTKCGQVVFQKSLKEVVRCNETDYKVDNQDVVLVEVSYGLPVDCPSGCLYHSYVGIVDSSGIHDFNLAPNLFHLILDEYGEQCARFNYHDTSKSFRKYIIKRNSVFYWAYDFSEFKVEENLGEYEDYYPKKFKQNSESCVINGTLIVTSVEGGYAQEADFSQFNIEFRPRN